MVLWLLCETTGVAYWCCRSSVVVRMLCGLKQPVNCLMQSCGFPVTFLLCLCINSPFPWCVCVCVHKISLPIVCVSVCACVCMHARMHVYVCMTTICICVYTCDSMRV